MERIDAQAQVLAIARGLGVPHPPSWLWLQPGQLELICQAIAKQAMKAATVSGGIE